jgi:hypothetical protein
MTTTLHSGLSGMLKILDQLLIFLDIGDFEIGKYLLILQKDQSNKRYVWTFDNFFRFCCTPAKKKIRTKNKIILANFIIAVSSGVLWE